MSSSDSESTRQHAFSGPAQPQVPEPPHAERVRTLLSLASTGTLCTVSRKQPGFPFGSLMPFALDKAGRPLLLISNMAMHTQNLREDPRCSLFVAQMAGQPGSQSADSDPLGAARVTLIANAHPVPPNDLAEAREAYLARHANSRYWVDFADFSFFRLEPVDLYYVGGFGVMGWVKSSDYDAAEPDPLAQSAAGIIAHMNADHQDSMLLLARVLTGIAATEAAMTSIDRLGFTLRLQTADGIKGPRIAFPRQVRTPQDTRKALVEMVEEARSSATSTGKPSTHSSTTPKENA